VRREEERGEEGKRARGEEGGREEDEGGEKCTKDFRG
jgi:hypothetical protein